MKLMTRIIFTLVSLLAISCGGEEYVSPSFPEGTIPTITITGATSDDTGIFAATADITSKQSFNISLNTEGTIFPDCTASNSTISIADEEGGFILSYTTGASTFSISPTGENESSSQITARITAMVDSSYGGSVSTMDLVQAAADIPYFSTQPRDVTFSGTVSSGSTAMSYFVIDPMSVEGINLDSFTVTTSPYFEVVLTETAGVENGYTITFTATLAAVNALSSSEDDLVISCTVTLTYDETTTEVSDTFTVTMSD